MKINLKVIKRDGRTEEFNSDKIKTAITKTAVEIKEKFGDDEWNELKPILANELEKLAEKEIVSIGEIDDIVMETLIYSSFKNIAIAYIKYRKTKVYNNVNDMGLGKVSMQLLGDRYLETDEERSIVETPKEMMLRISTAIASVEKGTDLKIKYKDEFFKMLCNMEFLPNSPCMVSAGSKRKGTLLACFAYNIPDSMDGMFDTYKLIANTFKMGGGVGISIADVRESGAYIKTTKGFSSGPVKLVLPVVDSVTEGIKQGSFRRGALMCVLSDYHPDLESFIDAKYDTSKLNNMNMSIMVCNKFMNAVKKGGELELTSPATGKLVKKVSASYIFDKIATRMWETGEPGILFKDRINKDNPTPHLGELKLVNPCAESVLYDREACDLGSINLVRHIVDKKFDWDKFAHTIKLGLRFLDNILDKSAYPDPSVKSAVLRTRKVGLGIMGFADALIMMDIKYSSAEAVKFVDKLMSFMRKVAEQESAKLGHEKGLYDGYKDGCPKRRNAIVLTLAPTGSIALIAGVSSGIEPNFNKSYSRTFYPENETVTIEHPLKDNPVFETTYDITPEQHVKILSAFQKHVDNACSKTINCPEETSIEDIKKLIFLAWESGVKGLTIFRKNCRRKALIKCDGDQCML